MYYNKFIIVLAFIFIAGAYAPALAQTKIGYVDSKKIVESLQESRDAKVRLDGLVELWQIELKEMNDSLAAYKEDYEKKKLILTDQLKQQFETNITTLESKISEFKMQKFGEGGEYFQKQIEFMKPVQDRVFTAIDMVAKDDDYDMIIDRSSDVILLYVNEKLDITGKVIALINANR